MENSRPSSPRKAAAARKNGNLGGTKNPDRSRWGALHHCLNAKKLTILEGKHLAEYGEYAALHAALVKALSPCSIAEFIVIEKFIADAWRLRRAFRFELSATEKPDAGMSSAGMPNLLRYMNSANRQFDESYERIKEICAHKHTSAATHLAAAVAHARGGEELTPCESTAADGLPQTASVNVEPLDSTPSTCNPENGLERQQPTHGVLPATSADPGNGPGGTPEEAAPASAAVPARPAQSTGGANPTPVNEVDRKPDAPGAG